MKDETSKLLSRIKDLALKLDQKTKELETTKDQIIQNSKIYE